MSIAIDRALCDPQLLGAALGDVSTWRTWPAILRAAFALTMDDEDRALFAAVSGGRADPGHQTRRAPGARWSGYARGIPDS
jgi:hypothetical protein